MYYKGVVEKDDDFFYNLFYVKNTCEGKFCILKVKRC